MMRGGGWQTCLLVCASIVHGQTPNDRTVVHRDPLNLIRRATVLSGAGHDTVYQLPDRFLIPGSEKISLSGLILQRERDYVIRYRDGEIEFLFVVAEKQPIDLQYEIFPFGLQPTYRRRVPIGMDTSTTVSTAFGFSGDRGQTGYSGSRLYGNGTITRGFTVGSGQDMTIESGLNVQIYGNLSDDVTIEASLTDQNLPIQPEGNTETLQEIDQIYVRINKGDRYVATVGDVDVAHKGTSFGEYTRLVQGLQVSIVEKTVQANAVIAAAKGKYATNTLSIIEGNQGPYQLTGESGEGSIVVVAGSEQVWIDGVPARRGEQNDYVMDYNAAQITFTRNRMITPASRVVVDFEYSDDIFTRNSLAAFVRKSFADDRFVFGTHFIREYDDKSNPISFSVSRELEDSLRNINDDSLTGSSPAIYVDGGQRVEFGRGAYRKVFETTTSESIYVYAGIDSMGDYNVRFTEFGAGSGRYVRGNILGEFVYVGPGQGSFEAVVLLTLPVESNLGLTYAEFRPSRFIFMRSEFAWSVFDQNAYSPDQIKGTAFDLKVDATNFPLKIVTLRAGSVNVNGRWRHQGSTFRQLNRINPAEFRRDWNLNTTPGASEPSGEDLREISVAYLPIRQIRLHGAYGSLSREAFDFASRRISWGTVIIDEAKYGIDYAGSNIRSDVGLDSSVLQSKTNRTRLTSFYRLGPFLPGFDFEREHMQNAALSGDSVYGASYNLFRPRLEIVDLRHLKLGYLAEVRVDRQVNSAVDSLDGKVSVATIQQYYAQVSDWHRFSSQVSFIQRYRRFKGLFRTAENPDRRTRLVNASADYHTRDKNASFGLNYQLSSENLQDRKLVFVPVLPNTGNFIRVSADSFMQVPAGQGDWIQGSVRAASFTPIVEVRAGFRWRVRIASVFSSDADSSRSDGWRSSTSEGNLQINESQENPGTGFYFLNFHSLQLPSRTISGSFWFRHDLTAFFADWDWRLRLEKTGSLSVLGSDGFERRRISGLNLRLRFRYNDRWSTEHITDYQTSDRKTTSTFSSFGGGFSISQPGLTNSVTIKPRYEWEFTQTTSVFHPRDEQNGTSAWMTALEPKVTFALRERGRVVGSYRWTHVAIEGNLAPVFELTGGLPDGVTSQWNLNGEYRLGNHVSAILSYTGRKAPKQEIFHLASMEFRAYF